MVYLATILLASVLVQSILSSNAWNDPTRNQYHIQTDEGPERYFRYQTQNGQYRKEKRLADGTVVGSYAWIDDNGYLRQRDYVADAQGYRIVKNKNIYVGRNVNVGDAVKAAKGISSANESPTVNLKPSGELPSKDYVAITQKPIYAVSGLPSVEVSLNSIASSTPVPLIPTNTLIAPYSGSFEWSSNNIESEYVSSTPRPFSLSTTIDPVSSFSPSSTSIEPAHLSIYSKNLTQVSYQESPTKLYVPSVTRPPVHFPVLSAPTLSIPSTGLSPPLTGSKLYVASATAPPVSYSFSSNPLEISSHLIPSTTPIYPSRSISSSTPASIYFSSSTPHYLSITPLPKRYSSKSKLVNHNGLEYSETPQYDHYNDNFINPYIHQNGPTYPIDTRGQSFNPIYNKLGNGYDPQYPYYDGISVTNDGFRYYIPRAYHEEQNVDYNRKSGSFGYIDPFGIRRVIYYNAGPEGFKHKKNNRYVGFDATPYDPRPY